MASAAALTEPELPELTAPPAENHYLKDNKPVAVNGATKNSSAPVSDEFIKDAINIATINSLRLALYQTTGDPELANMKVSKEPIRGGAMLDYVLSKEDEEIVKAKALEFLKLQETHNGPNTPVEFSQPSLEDSSKLMKVFTGEDLKPRELQLGHEELAFEPFPREVKWTKKPSADALKNFHVVVVGAGINGISTAVSLQRLGINYTVIDRQADTGGTWVVNTYPEARVDTLGFSFQYKFERDYKWKEMFPGASELRKYLDHVATKFGVKPQFKFNRELVAATWDEPSSSWQLTLKLPDGTTEPMTANAIVSCGGLFATPNVPQFPGSDSFTGRIFHTTAWDHSFDYRNKRIAVIGNGSSGAQLMPGLARDAKSLAMYQRTAQWIAPYDGYRAAVPAHMDWMLDHMPYYRNWYGFAAYIRGMQLPPLQVEDPAWVAAGGFVNARNDGMRKGLTEYIKSQVGADSPLVPKLTPTFAPLVRRLVVDNGYYKALTQPNVELVTETIERFTPNGILTKDGKERSFDLIVLGSGFKPTEYLHPCAYTGRAAVTLSKTWAKDGARSYLGLTIPGYPNLFTLYGPNHQPRGGPSLHSWSEIWGRYAISCIVYMLEEGKKSMEVKQSVYDEYNARLDEENSKLIWEKEGRGYFVNAWGRQGVNMPWTADVYHEWVAKVNVGDYVVT
ncbi:FAD/NAD(P)-binding domain-containing protein [Lepidopterella palustris CBS 459.81]|uniref:FAD/NAD(P)-binding domain-containing protein n=1 Tax=Lepidopterella palustris CBS 459.81 TaxID=1314670 RepID=A0A8E2JHT2_9PEZI|nr:FAD/NAD(P)-binding domain-containing protein [Lepidopterella palustris CBS 459.81]